MKAKPLSRPKVHNKQVMYEMICLSWRVCGASTCFRGPAGTVTLAKLKGKAVRFQPTVTVDVPGQFRAPVNKPDCMCAIASPSRLPVFHM